MKVLFDHHSPFMLAHGGFQIQIEQTFRGLREAGVDVDWMRFWDDSQLPDLIHFFGKPHTGYLNHARSKGVKTVINELHTGLGSRARWKHNLQGAIIGSVLTCAPAIAARMDWDTYVNSDAIMALTPYEADLMCNIFHAPREKVHVIPNGVETFLLKVTEIPREDWLMCTAVIHPRKRVLELVEAATLANVPLKIFGRPYSNSDVYFQRFERAVKESAGIVSWEGNVSDRRVLGDLYRRARGFVLPSTMESLSLSALEAAATGCPLLLSDLPWATTTFGSHASYLPVSANRTTMAAFLNSFFTDPKSPDGYRVLSWGDVAEKLKSLYCSIL